MIAAHLRDVRLHFISCGNELMDGENILLAQAFKAWAKREREF